MISIVVPTYNERDNVEIIAGAIHGALQGIDHEILYVDDSKDDTPSILAKLAERDPQVRYIHRENERGLGTAVICGFHKASGNYITVMDADLQHPPEMLPAMIRELEAGADIVIPSRFVPGGDDGGLKPHRKLVSAVARYIGKIAIKKLRPISDPTGGFFAFRKCIIEGVQLKPIGWKILIEVLVRGNYKHVTEIPYKFRPRNAGASKMSLKEQWNYIRHLYILASYSKEDRRFFLFAAVGISGVIVNTLLYSLFVRCGMDVTIASLISALVALASNFTLNDRITWSDVKEHGWFVRAAKYFATSLAGIGVNVGILHLLYYEAHLHYLASNLIGIAVATVWNYLISNLWTWRSDKKHSIDVTRPLAVDEH